MEAVGQLTLALRMLQQHACGCVGGIHLARRLNGPRREVVNHLTNAMEGATRAAALTRRLLSFARSEPLLPERLDTAILVGGMSELLDRTLGERINVKTDLAGDAWPVFVDPHQLENAILNLAVNARDAMDGTGNLTIRSRNVTMESNSVGDIRAGEYGHRSHRHRLRHDPEVKERAFGLLHPKAVGKGTGLGLSKISVSPPSGARSASKRDWQGHDGSIYLHEPMPGKQCPGASGDAGKGGGRHDRARRAHLMVG